jgi:hydrogenase maturation protease
VEVDDWSFGPIDVVHRQHERPGYYGRIIFVSAVERGRTPGSVICYRWQGQLPSPEEVQQSVYEAGAGVISIDNLLIVAEQFKALPGEVFVVEVEPLDLGWGDGFSPVVEAALPEVVAAVRRLVDDE